MSIITFLLLISIPHLCLADIDIDLVASAEVGDIETARELIQKGANVNARIHNGGTALILASMNGHTKTVALLLEKKRGTTLNY